MNDNTYTTRQRLLDSIDWTQVEEVFRQLGHEWYTADGLRVPTAAELRAHASGLLRDVSPGDSLSAGRLSATHRGGTLRLNVHAFEAFATID
jgi:hypothetical protein